MKFQNTILIEAPANELFDYLQDLTNIPAWNYAIESTVQKTPGTVGIGTLYTQRRVLPKRMSEELEITAYIPNRLLAFNGGFAFFHGTATYELSPVDTHRTRLTNSMDLKATGISKLLEPLASMQLKKAVAQNLSVLKKHMEAK